MSIIVNSGRENQAIQEKEAAKQETHIFELTMAEFDSKYGNVKQEVSSRDSGTAPSVSEVTSEKCKTRGVSNCTSVTILTSEKTGIMMHIIPSKVNEGIEKMITRLISSFNKEHAMVAILVAGGADDGAKAAEEAYKDFKEATHDVIRVTPPNEDSSISIGFDPELSRIEYAIFKYPPLPVGFAGNTNTKATTRLN